MSIKESLNIDNKKQEFIDHICELTDRYCKGKENQTIELRKEMKRFIIAIIRDK